MEEDTGIVDGSPLAEPPFQPAPTMRISARAPRNALRCYEGYRLFWTNSRFQCHFGSFVNWLISMS
ncbi:hypothetical protein BDV09DRAFT_161255 [Aspergillus tetrazonus]